MRWEDLTSPELDAISRDTVVLLSVAAIEQHGPHMALATDAAIGRHLLEGLERACGADILLLPQVAVGCSEHHMDFPGSLSVRHETLIAYAGDILRSVIRHGFRNLVILNSHGGNQAAGQVLAETIGAAHPEFRVAMLTWWRLAGPDLAAIRDSAPGGANHACEFETSLMLHAAPALVRPDRIPPRSHAPAPAWAEEDMLVGSRGTLYRSMREKSGGNGVVGEPALATAAKGAAMAEAIVARLAEVVRDLRHGAAARPEGGPA